MSYIQTSTRITIHTEAFQKEHWIITRCNKSILSQTISDIHRHAEDFNVGALTLNDDDDTALYCRDRMVLKCLIMKGWSSSH